MENKSTYVLFLVVIISLFLFFPLNSNAIQRAPTESEMNLLPKYCAVKYKYEHRKTPEVKYWKKTLGDNYGDIHHYCNGLNFINRAYKSKSLGERKDWVNKAIGEISYVIKAAKPGFPLLPELYLNRGKAYELKGELVEATKDYKKSIETKPDYSKAYVYYFDLLFERQKDYAQAEKVLEEGLKKSPKSKALKRRWKRLKKATDMKKE